VLLGVGAAVVVAAAVTAILLTTGGGKTTPKAVGAPSPATTLRAALAQHAFIGSECKPINGPSWVFPGPTKITSNLYETFSIHYPCAKAQAWIRKLAAETIRVSKVGDNIAVNGPAGWDCGAWADENGHAYAGGCQNGTQQGFGWNWNVANPRVTMTPNQEGQVKLTKVYGSDDLTVVRPLGKKGRFQLYVENTSGIGFINAFTWHPPPGWTIQKLTSIKGADCALRADGTIHCNGSVRPPVCLCNGSGGNVVIDMNVSTKANTKKKTYGAVGAKLQLDKMTFVPFLIPGTPKELKAEKQAQAGA
jgi:hypothetical protein